METTKLINLILETFDFEKVKDYMAEVDWCYFDDDEPPTFGKLLHLARHLLETVASNGGYASSGGFVAFNSNGSLHLVFALTENDGCPEDLD